MQIISSLAELEQYVARHHSDLHEHARADLVDALAEHYDRPTFGRDWSEWLDRHLAQVKGYVVDRWT